MKNFKLLITLGFFAGMLGLTTNTPQFTALYFIGFSVLAFVLPKNVRAGVFTADISPDVTKISTYIGKVREGIIPKLVNSLDIANDITLVANVKNVSVSTSLKIKNGPKPYTGVFNPMGDDLDYEPRLLTVEPFQRDLLIDPRKYRKSHFAYTRGAGESAKNNKIPFEDFTMKTVLENDAAIMNNQTAFFGVGIGAFPAYNAGTAYAVGQRMKISHKGEIQYFTAKVATTAGQTPETNPENWTNSNALAICIGLGTRLIEARNGSEIQKVIAAGSLSAYDLYKKVFRAHSDARKALGVRIYSNVSKTEELMDDFENKVGKYTENDGSGRIYLANTNKKALIVPATWMSGSNTIFSGPMENFEMGTDLLSDSNQVNVIPDVYQLKMGVTGLIGFNFQDPEEITMTDQD